MNTNSKLAFLLPIRCVAFFLTFVIIALISNKSLDEVSNSWSIVANIINILLIGLLILIARMNNTSFCQVINLKKGQTKVWHVIVVIPVFFALAFLGMNLSGLICYQQIPYVPTEMLVPIPLWLAIINLIVLPVSTAIAEDSLYLGFGVGQISNKYMAIIVPAFFYALQHSFIPTVFDIRFMLYRFISFLPLAAFLCIYYYRKRHILPIMIAHTLIDVLSALQILQMSIGG